MNTKKEQPHPPQWLAVYTKPRWEKKVHRLLEEKGITAYCPLNIVYRKWTDRLKKVEEPLFKSYVFVQVTQAQQTEVRLTDGVLNFVYWLGKPAVIKPQEIEAIRKFLNEHEDVVAEAYDRMEPGALVTIQSGLMMGSDAIVEKVDNRWAEVVIESIGFRLRAKIPRTRLTVKKRNASGISPAEK